MRNSLPFLVLALTFLAVSSTAHALDYENWTPLIPDTMGGLEKQGDPKGMNSEKGGQAWSVLRQDYSGEEGAKARISIVAGSEAPGLTRFKKMRQFNMETEENVVRSTEIAGYKAVVNLDKQGGKSHLYIAVTDNAVVIIDTAVVDNEDDLVSLADDIPLSDIAEATD